MTAIDGRSTGEHGASLLSPSLNLRGGERTLELDRPRLLGILNVTPDSFSDGGRYMDLGHAIARAAEMVEQGADIIDVGGESTRPQNAAPVPAREEIDRVVPVVSELVARFPSIIVSVDTVKSQVAEAALDAGAMLINDVSALRLDERIAEACARHEAGLILMHSRGDVQDMASYDHARYGEDVVADVIQELSTAIGKARKRGVSGESIVIDPGIGFSKLTVHSLALLRQLSRLVELGHPVLVGVSRKRLIGELSGVQEPAARTMGSVAAAVVALANGARLFRVHDVAETRQALDVAWGILASDGE